MRRTALRTEQLEDRTTPSFGFDQSFGVTGRVDLWPTHTGTSPAVAVQTDGGILTATRALDGPVIPGDYQVHTELIRFNPDGTRDATFGNGDRVYFTQAVAGAKIAVGPDGRIYVAANIRNPSATFDSGTDVIVYCYNPDGTRDTTFGDGGVVRFDFPGVPRAESSFVWALVVQPDGKVVVAGDAQQTFSTINDEYGNPGGITHVYVPPGYSLARLNTDGSPDTTFDRDGFVRHTFSDDLRFGSVQDVEIGAGGTILVAGSVTVFGDPFTYRAAVVRLHSDGSRDDTFDGDGEWIGRDDTAASGVIQLADGRILVSGLVDRAPSVIRLTSAGSIDGTFGDGDWTVVNPQLPYGTVDAALLPDGRIAVVSASGDYALTKRVAVAVLSADGDRVPAFAGGELFDVVYDPAELGRETVPGDSTIAVTPDGRLVIVSMLARAEVNRTAYSMGVAVLADDSHLLPPTTHSAMMLANRERVATADVNGDGTPDTVTVTAPGEPIRVTVLSGKDGTTALIPAFDPFGGEFTGGGFVVAADLDGDGYAEFIVSPDQGGGPRVAVFSMIQLKIPESTDIVWQRANFFAIDDPSFRGGVRLALGDVNGDGTPDLAVTAGFLGGPRVALLDGKTLTTTPTRLAGDFFAFPGDDAQTLRNGATMALGDVNGDGRADFVFGGGPGGAARVYILDGATVAAGDVAAAHANPLANFFVAGNTTDRDGVRVAAGDTDGDGRADVMASHGEARLRVYRGKDIGGAGEPTRFEDIDLSAATTGVFVG